MSQTSSSEAVEFLTEFTEDYEQEHFGERVAEVGETVKTIGETDPKTFLKFLYTHYAFNRAGGAKAGYPAYAVDAVDEVGVSPDALWEEFKSTCEETGTGLNKRMNYGAVRGVAELVCEHGNLFSWTAAHVVDGGSVEPVYEAVNGVQGIGDKITRFFLRDAVWVTGVEDRVPESETQLLHPMDVWTRRASFVLWPDVWGASDAELSVKAATVCNEEGVSHAEFNQGAWYLGAKFVDGDNEAFVRELNNIF